MNWTAHWLLLRIIKRNHNNNKCRIIVYHCVQCGATQFLFYFFALQFNAMQYTQMIICLVFVESLELLNGACRNFVFIFFLLCNINRIVIAIIYSVCLNEVFIKKNVFFFFRCCYISPLLFSCSTCFYSVFVAWNGTTRRRCSITCLLFECRYIFLFSCICSRSVQHWNETMCVREIFLVRILVKMHCKTIINI